MQQNQTIRKFDKSNILEITYNMPDDASSALKNSLNLEFPENYKEIKNIIISGMGGSCISGDLLRNYVYDKSEIPVTVNRSSVLPGFAGKDTLCVFLSYSGNTQETLMCTKEALKRGCKIIIVSRGGEIVNIAKENNIPLVQIQGKEKMPRAAIGDLFFSLVGIMSKIKGLNISISEVESSINSLDEIRKEYDIKHKTDNYLLQLALKLKDKNIVIFGITPYTESIALRWKNQFNENSKKTVIFNSFPELTHNEIINMASQELDIENYYFIVLRDQNEDKFLKKQVDTTLSFFEKSAGIDNIATKGDNILERQIKMLYMGDYLSIYLALLRGVDPSPIEAIMSLKEKMKELDK